jgi:hypothetical protein
MSDAITFNLPPYPRNLEMWVIYDRPLDYPHCAIARLFHATPDGRSVPKLDTIIGPTVQDVRNQLPPTANVRFERAPSDDPCIVETWM